MARKKYSGRPDWAQAKDVLWDLLTRLGEASPEIGRLKFVGKGLHFRGLATEVQLAGEPVDVVVRVPVYDSKLEDQMVQQAVDVRRQLLDFELPFRVAEPLGTAPADHGLAVVDRWVPGASLGDKMIQEVFDAVGITATAAAGCHGVDPEPFRSILSGFSTRREHAESTLDVFEQDDSTEFRDAGQWVREHLPPPTPSRLLHGDLLGQNILVAFDGLPENWNASVIDWIYAQMGDPAYDLAVVTRGTKKVFRTGESLEDLLIAYNERAAASLDIEHVRIWELWLKACFYLGEVQETGESDHARHLFNAFRNVLKRC